MLAVYFIQKVGKMEKIETLQAPKAIGPYSQAVKSGNLLFVSGQLPVDPKTGQLISGDMVELTRQVLLNLKAILEEAGSALDQVVRCDVFLTDLKNDFPQMNAEYGKHFDVSCPPARQTVQVAALPLGSPIEISCIAVV